MFYLMKYLLMVLFVITLGVAGVYVSYNRGLLSGDSFGQIGAFFDNKIPFLETSFKPATITKATDFSQLPQSTQDQISITVKRAQALTQQSGAVLGDFVEVNQKDQERSTQEKALEYGQYLYCKQVVESWEAIDSKAE